MSDDLENMDGEFDGDDLASGLKPKKFAGKKLILFIVAPLVLLLVLGGVAFTLMGGGDETDVAHAEADEPAPVEEPREVLFYDLPDMLVNLNSAGRKASYLKVKVALEVDRQSALKDLEEKMPRVIDDFQIYLRELRLEDLNGSAGMFRLKEELLRRVNTSLYPTKVKDVLFKEMLVQ
jgi:flagellar FliL protein